MTQPEVSFANDQDVEDALIAGLEAFNDGHTESSGYKPMQCVLRDDAGKIIGGAMGQILFRWLNIKYVWVDESIRGTGQGEIIVQTLLDEAKKAGAIAAKVNTFSFQARGFYEGLGFAVFSTLDGFPPGSATHYMSRKL